MAAALRRAGAGEAPEIRRLPTRVPLSELPESVGGLPVLGLADDDLQPLVFNPRGAFILSGPPHSGRTTALATLSLAVARWQPEARLVYFGNPRSPLLSAVPWADVATDPDTIAALAKDVLARIEDDGAPLHWVVVENVAELNGTSAESAVSGLITTLRTRGHGVVGDGEAGTLTQFQSPLPALRADRMGFALQPDSNDGGSLFQAGFGNAVRAEFPPGRGFHVVRGTVTRAQLAVPE
jgi:S-DNA-T family DNA segregation ATPase FtsK/SpoIIIE